VNRALFRAELTSAQSVLVSTFRLTHVPLEGRSAVSNANGKPVEQDWRFAELVARTWMEPGLVDRYATDPCSVLAEFGLTVTRSEDAPSLEPYCGSELIIEDLEHARGIRPTHSNCCYSFEDQQSDETAGPHSDPAQTAEPCA
jgi:putative thiazole/oxazole-modified microcin (TOMM)-like peptide